MDIKLTTNLNKFTNFTKPNYEHKLNHTLLHKK